MSNRLPNIVIDPGHGGREKTGGSSPNNAVGANGLLEKDLTLDIARRTASVLNDTANVFLTRDADVNLSLAARARFARQNNADVFLSIHFNGFPDKTIDGVETFVASRANPQSQTFAQNVLHNLVKATRTNDRGIRSADLGVLIPDRHSPQTAACLAEISFLTNPAGAQKLEDNAYRQQIAIALGDAVLKSLPKAPQSFSLDYEDDLDAGYFQPLDFEALGGDPVFDIKRAVNKDSANGDDIYAVKNRLIELGFDWITLDKKMDTATIGAIKLFQTIISGKNSISGDGKIDVGKTTHLWLQAVNAPRWQTMPAGSQAEGFINYELTDTADTHDFGTDWMADTIRSAAAHYRDNHLKTNSSAALFTVNDVSLPRGGDTPDHDGHEAGLACDMQLPRTDGKAGGINLTKPAEMARFDRDAARAVLKALRAQTLVTNIYLNDTTLINEGLCTRLAGHDHHIHFEIKPPARGAIERHDLKHYHSGGRLYQGSYQDDIDYQSHALKVSCPNINIQPDKKHLEFSAMGTTSNRANAKENLFVVWNCIPKNTKEIDVVVFLHGWNITGEKKFFDFVVDNSGLDLSNRPRPTLCILPFGQASPQLEDGRIPYSFGFISGKPGDGLQRLIDFSLKEFAKPNTFTQKRLILIGHSGGGAVVRDILNFKKYSIDEIHLFDAIYGCKGDEGCQYRPVKEWADARIKADKTLSTANIKAKGQFTEADMLNEGGALRVIYEGTTLSEKTLPPGKLGAPLDEFYKVEKTLCNHNIIPKDFGPALLEKANAVLNVNKCNPPPKPKPTPKPVVGPKSLAYYNEDEVDYFADREASYFNY